MALRAPIRSHRLRAIGTVAALTTLLWLVASHGPGPATLLESTPAPARRIAAAQDLPVVGRVFLPLLELERSGPKAPEAEQSPAAPAASAPRELVVLPERNLMLVADETLGLRIFDVARVGSPRELSRLLMWRPDPDPGATGASYLSAEGNHAYVLFDGYRLAVVDISDPSRPTQVATYVPPAPTTLDDALVVPAWRQLVVRTFGYNLVLLDIQRPEQPRPSQEFAGSRRCPGIGFIDSILQHKDSVYSVRSCEIDVLSRDPGSGEVTRRAVAHQLPAASDAALAADLERLYVVGAGGGLEVFDVSVADEPRSIRLFTPAAWRFNTLDLGPTGRGVARVSHLDEERSNLYPVDLSTLDGLQVADPHELDGWSKIGRDVRIAGDRAYLAAEPYRGNKELYIFTGLDRLQLRQAARMR